MIARVLPFSEWDRVHGKGFDGMLPLLDPSNAAVVVVEDGGEVVAHLGVLRVTHLESLWIHPAYRGNAGVGRSLLRKAMEVVRPWARRWCMAQVADEHVRELVHKLGGVRIEADSYALSVGGDDA